MEKEYQNLFAGCVRQKGDEVRHLALGKVKWSDTFCTNSPTKVGPWEPVSLLNHTILQSDLMVAKFRRPI